MDILMFALMRTIEDKKIFYKDVKPFIKHNPDANIYLIMLGPTTSSKTNGLYYNGKLLYDYDCGTKSNSEKIYYTYLDNTMKRLPIKRFDYLLFYGHSNGFTLGGRVNSYSPMIEFSKFSHLLDKYALSFNTIFFEGCYFGTISGIIEFFKYAKYIVGSTGYYSGHCFLPLLDIKIPITEEYLLSLLSKYYSRKIPKYSCINVYNCKYIPLLVNYIKNDLDLPKLDFRKENQHTKSDKNSFTFSKSDKSQKLKNILNTILVNKNTPCDVSIECCVYEESYKNTKYYKLLNNKNKIFLENAVVN